MMNWNWCSRPTGIRNAAVGCAQQQQKPRVSGAWGCGFVASAIYSSRNSFRLSLLYSIIDAKNSANET